MARATVAIVLAYPWTDGEGGEHAPDERLDLEAGAASALVRSGRARFAPPKTPAPITGVVASKKKETQDG